MKRVLLAATLLSVGVARPGVTQEREVLVWGAVGRISPREGDGVTDAVGLGNLYGGARSWVAGIAHGISRRFAVRAEFEKNRLPYDEDNGFSFSHPSNSGRLVAGEPARIWAGAIGLTFAPLRLPVAAPYAVVALGVSHVAWSVTERDERVVPRFVDPTGVQRTTFLIASSHTRPSLSLGLGLKISATRWTGVMGECRYHRAFTPPSAPMTEGLFVKRATYLTARAGLYVRVH